MADPTSGWFRNVPQCVRVKADGLRCRRPASRGLTVCHVHGGRLPHVREAARRRVAVSVLEERFARELGVGPVDPVRELEGEIRRTKAQILALESVLYGGSLDGHVMWTDQQEGVVRSRVESAVATHLHRKQQHFAGLLVSALKLGLEDRRVRVAEREAELVANAFARSMVELGVDSLEARAVLARNLSLEGVGVLRGEPEPLADVSVLPELGGGSLGPDLDLGLDLRPEQVANGTRPRGQRSGRADARELRIPTIGEESVLAAEIAEEERVVWEAERESRILGEDER